jgi:hypothetical protein
MIRVVMLGRTGNNLFQYALGRVLSRRHDVPLVMDGSWFDRSGWRTAGCLSRLPLQGRVRRGSSLPSRLLRKLTGRHPWELCGLPVFKEVSGHTGFDPRFLGAPAECVLMGYFQSPRYFESIREELRRDLDMSELPWSLPTRALAERLEGQESVAVHVRRTDFVGRQEFDLCGPGYYREAMARLRRDLGLPCFFVFSDDPAWCRGTFAEEDVEIVEVPGTAQDPLHDLFLMSRARHHIIANSSYSWWAAWLAKRPGQRVLSPDRWFGGDIEAPMADRLCEGWETVSVSG